MLDAVLIAVFALLAGVQASALLIYCFPDRKTVKNFMPPVSVIIPAHNEEKTIADTLRTVLSSDYKNRIDIIVVDDGSKDGTAGAVRKISAKHGNVRLFAIPHSGKSAALNFATGKAKYDTIIMIDADSSLEKDSLRKLVAPMADKEISAVSGVIRARCTKNPLTWMQDIDYIVSSSWRYVSSKIDATYAMPGFAAFRKSCLMRVGGFSRDTLTEDLDIGLELRKHGYRTAMSSAAMRTTVPSSWRSFFRQRMRWGRGSIQVAKKHSDMILSRKFSLVGMYSFPMHLFWYAFAVFYVPLLFYWFLGDYVHYFLLSGAAHSLDGVLFLFKWLTVYGVLEMIYNSVVSQTISTLGALVIAAWGFSFAYFAVAVRKFSGISWKTAAAYIIIFPYHWIVMTIQGISVVLGLFSSGPINKWDKDTARS